MKYYEQLVDMGCFSLADVTAITGNEDTARSVLYSYQKRGLIASVRRSLYVAMSLETKQPIPNRYAIASHIADGAYVSHHSAFEVHGVANQVYYEVYVVSEKRFTEFEYDSVNYRRVTPGISKGVGTMQSGVASGKVVRVTDIERTVLDSIRDFEKIGGLEETLKCIELIPRLDENKLLEYLSEYGNGYLYQRTGYLLSQSTTLFELSDSFYAACQSKMPSAKRYLYNGLQNEPHKLSSDWRLFAPESLSKGDIYSDDV
jgi:predicted transcriptional regulator of viral defense system